jgi:hypothetical protein
MIDWAAEEGWNPGLGDADPFWAADPQGYLMVFEGDAPIASISVVRYTDRLGFLGFYIVRADRRGRGIGLGLWAEGMAYLAGGTVALDGVVPQQPNYRRSGFALAHRNVRHTGSIVAERPADPRIVPAGTLALEDVAAFDAVRFGARRDGFLSAWLDGGSGRRGWAFVEDGTLLGYGVVRPCRVGFKIGPLFADRADVAEALFLALAAETGGAPVILDLPLDNREALALAGRHGLEPGFETGRMYHGPAPVLPLDRIYGITTFELG